MRSETLTLGRDGMAKRARDAAGARPAGAPLALLVLLFVGSGAGALIIETTWLRWFRLLFGATAPAASATLVAFLCGHAIGAALAARRVPRWRRPLAGYGAIELAGAGAGLAVPLGLGLGEAWVSSVYEALRGHPVALTSARFALALAATLPTAVCFGATLPAMGAAAVRDSRGLGTAGSGLYAANTFGAAVGSALAAFVLFERLGVRASYGVALVLLASIGAAAVVLGARSRDPSHGHEAPAPRATSRRAAPRTARAAGDLLALAALSGFGTFAGQVLLVQAFSQVLNQSVYAFGAVLVVVLATLAAGAALVGAIERRGAIDPRTLLGIALAATALALAGFPALLHAATGGYAYVGSGRPWPSYVFEALGLAARTGGPALLPAALVFPLTFALAARRSAGRRGAASPGAQLGRLAAANTLGAVAGALAAPFALLPAFGIWPAFAALAAVYAAAAVAVPDASARRRTVRASAVAAGAVGLLALASPFDLPFVNLEDGEELVAVETTPAGVVAVVERRGGERLIRTDNHYTLGGTGGAVRQEREGHLPLLLHPRPRRVAFIGSATGISASASLLHPTERLAVVEIVPGVARAAARYFGAYNRGVYAHPRTEVVLDDARNFMRASRRTFDVVVADLFVPWRAGTGSLYTQEHFAAVRARLAPGGIFCQWLPLYQLSREEFLSIAATFSDVFPTAAVFRGDFYGAYPIAGLVGYTGRPAAPEAVAEAARRLGRRGVPDRWVTDPAGVWALYAGPLGAAAEALAYAPRNTDDSPRIEFLAARTHRGGDAGKEAPFVNLAWARFSASLLRRAAEGRPVRGRPYPDLPRAALDAARGGAALQLAGALYAMDRSAEAGRALRAAGDLLPPHLVAEAPPDSTAINVWHTEE